MAVLIVNDVTVKVAASSPPSRQTVEVGDYSRAFDGSDRGVIVTRKHIWTVETVPMSKSDADALVTAIDDTPPIVCSGDLLGGSVNCRGAVTGYQYATISGAMRVVVTFTLTEQ